MPGAMSGHPFLYDMYIMNRILIIILLLTCTVSHAQPPETVQHLGSTITTYGRKIISDKGSIWLTGEFNGELITDTQTDLTSALPTVFVARYSVEGIREHLSMIENESQVRSEHYGCSLGQTETKNCTPSLRKVSYPFLCHSQNIRISS